MKGPERRTGTQQAWRRSSSTAATARKLNTGDVQTPQTDVVPRSSHAVAAIAEERTRHYRCVVIETRLTASRHRH